MTELMHKKRRLRRIGAAVVLLAAVLSVFWMVSSRLPGKTTAQVEPEEGKGQADLPQTEPVASPNSSVSDQAAAAPPRSAPLPPIDTPLVAQLPDLLERAQARDPAASCRLAFAVTRCVEEVRRRETTRRLTESLQQRGSRNEEMLVGAIAASDVRNEVSNGYCEGVDIEALPNPDALLEATRPWLTPRQKTLLALMRSDGQIRRLHAPQTTFFEPGLYAIPQFQADHGYQFLLDGFAAHDPLALEGLLLTHAPGNAIPAQGVRIALPNPRLYVRYALLYRTLFGEAALGFAASEMLLSAAARMTPEALQQAERAAQIEAEPWRRAMATQAAQPRPRDNDDAKASEERMASCEE